MATITLKQEISAVLKDVLLKVCQKIAPFSEQLELHGLLLLETDGEEFCTVTFKDAKITKGGNTDGDQNALEPDNRDRVPQEDSSSCLTNGSSDSCRPQEEDSTATKRSLVSIAVQNAIDLWEGIRGSSQTSTNRGLSNNNGISSGLSSVEEIIRTYESKKRSWNQMNWKREKNKNGKYECLFCFREFSYATNLTRHQRTHHGRPQVRKPRHAVNASKKTTRSDDSGSDQMAGGSRALESEETIRKNSENSGNEEGSSSSFNQADITNAQNRSVSVNISSASPEIDYSDSTKNTQSFLTQNADFAGQGSVSIELNSSYMQTEFLTDDVYFGMPDADSASETTARIPPLQADNVNTSETQEYTHLNNSDDNNNNNNNNNTIVLADSYGSLPASLENPRDVTTQTSSDPNTNRTAIAATTTAASSHTVFKTQTGKEYVSIANAESCRLVHTCPLCQRKFDFYQNLGRHVSVSHGISIFQLEMQHNQSTEPQAGATRTDGEKKRFKCELCGHSFSFRSNLCRHKSKHHGKNSNQEKAKQNVKKTNSEANDGNQADKDATKLATAKYKCDVCSVMFTFTSSLSRHMRKKHRLVRANLYKTSEHVTSSQKTQSNTSQSNGSFANQPLDNAARTNHAEFAIPLTSYLPYGVSNIIQSNATNVPHKDTVATTGQILSSLNDNKQRMSSASLNVTEQGTNRERTEPHLNRLQTAGSTENHSKMNTYNLEKNKGSSRHSCDSKVELDTRTNIPQKRSSGGKAAESKMARKLPSERYRHKCNICNQMFTFRTNLTRHTRKIHRTCPDFPPESAPSTS